MGKIKNWISGGTGSFRISELSADDSVLSHLTTGTKYLECTSNGIIKINHNTTTDADASIDYNDGGGWTTVYGTLSDLITTHAWLSKDGNYLEFSLTTGQAIANIKLYDGVRQ